MEKPKIIEAINGELPEETIQHIQSYLSGKEAARTTILSKSWYNAWLTRPNLDIDENDIRTINFAPSQSAFVKFAEKTMQRYDELRLKIRSFKLRMRVEGIRVEWINGKRHESYELIQKAMKLGATDLVIEITEGVLFQIPPEVFESETLVSLSLTRCYMDRQYAIVHFSRLKSLILHKVYINSEKLMDIISMCPLIEKLVLTECNVHDAFERLVLEPRDFHKLRVLSLNKVIIGEWLFRDLSSRFPCLEDLALYHCIGYGKIQICSNSLERISITDHLEKFGVKFDVPRIKKFQFSTSSIPSLSFKTTSKEWESDIHIECRKETSSLIDVREFLQNLSPSKIHLELRITRLSEEYDYAGAIIGLCHKLPIVEKLTIHMNAPSSLYSTVLENLFWCCRPNFLELFLVPYNDFTKLLCNTLIEEFEASNGKRNISSMHDLEEVNVEFFESFKDGGFARWRSLPCKTLLDASAYSTNTEVTVFLQLKWAHMHRDEFIRAGDMYSGNTLC